MGVLIQHTGVVQGSEFFSLEPSSEARRLFYYAESVGDYLCDSDYIASRPHLSPLMDNFLIMLVVEGDGELEYRGERCELLLGDVAIVDCRLPHKYHTREGWHILWTHIAGNNTDGLVKLSYARKGCVMHAGLESSHARYLRLMLDSLRRGSYSEPLASCYIQRLLVEPIVDMSSSEREGVDPILEAIGYLRVNCSRNLTIQEVAEYTHLSVSHFTRVFKQKTGQSPYGYMMGIRLEHAKGLLKMTDLSVKEIAYKSGFSSESHFAYTFRKKEGQTPTQYRSRPLTK